MPRRTRNVKKTDQNKAWNKKRTVTKYKVETKDLPKTILIVCEGQTEKLYFESFPVLTLTVEAIDLGGQATLKMIESTAEIIKNSQKEYDEVWCVFDMDVNKGAKEFADFDNAIEKAKIQTPAYKVAYSNDAFELWFYLHYEYTDQQNLRQFYYDALSKFWNINYVKDGKKYAFCLEIYSLLEKDSNASQEEAIKRAEKLYEKQKHLIHHAQNPVTLVYQLVNFLNDNSRR